MATVDRLSGGRIILGAGLRVPEDYTDFGHEYNPRELGEKFDEALEIITGLWKGDPFSYEGDFFDIDDTELPVTPVQEPRIPIMLAGLWPNKKPFQRGGRWDGMMPFWDYYPELITEEDLREMTEYYRKHTDELGEFLIPVELSETPDDFINLCEDVGVTWLLAADVTRSDDPELIMERIDRGLRTKTAKP